MNDIRTLLRLAERRLETTAFVGRLHLVAVALAAVAGLLAVADRLPASPFVPWSWVAPALVVAAVGAAGIWWWRRRLTELQVAVSVDERLDLRERLSTALHVENRDDVFARAAIEDAVSTARDPRARETVRRRFAVTAPGRWWISPLLVMATVGILFLPQIDLFARDEPVDEKAMLVANVEVRQSLDAISQGLEDKPELSKALEDILGELGPQGLDEQASRPEDLKREALKRVTELNNRLDEIMNGEEGKTKRALENMLARLETPESGPAKELSEALARGDFQTAKKALDALKEQLENGQLTPEQKDQLAQQMEQLGQQMQQLAQQQQQLQQALQQAGLNPQLANNPQALQQAIQNAQNLNQQQKQQLQQMVQAQQQAQQMCKNMGGMCQNIGQGMQNGQFGQGMGELGQQLSDLEQMQQLLQQAQAMANQSMSQSQGLGQGIGLGQPRRGGGMGQRGQGSGGTAPKSPTPVGTTLTKENAPVVDGEIIASMMIEGHPIRGEAKAKLSSVIAEAARGYDEAGTENPLPRQYHEAQKHYFGELQRQIEAIPVEDEEPAPAPAPAPATGGTGAAGG